MDAKDIAIYLAVGTVGLVLAYEFVWPHISRWMGLIVVLGVVAAGVWYYFSD